MIRVNEGTLRNAKVSNNIDIKPTRQSFFGANHNEGRVAAPSAAIQNRAVVARSTPAPAASHLAVRSFSSGTMRPATERPGGTATGRAFENSANRPQGGVQSSMPMSAGRFNNSPLNGGAMSSRQRELSLDKPASAVRPNAETNANRGFHNNNSVRGGNAASNTRNWEAQGSSTDRGRAPAGFGNSSNSNRPVNNGSVGATARGTSMTHADRPPWAGTSNAPRSTIDRSNEGRFDGGNSNRPSNSGSFERGNSRSYQPPQRSYSQPRSYSTPEQRYSAPRSYSEPRGSYPSPSRGGYSGGGYSSPSRGGYSAPSHGYSAPSHSYGGGGSYHGGGGGGSSSHGRSGGGSSHTRNKRHNSGGVIRAFFSRPTFESPNVGFFAGIFCAYCAVETL
jgi:hypothetical protein